MSMKKYLVKIYYFNNINKKKYKSYIVEDDSPEQAVKKVKSDYEFIGETIYLDDIHLIH